MKVYSNRSNALRAAKPAGHQPADVAIIAEGDGFVFQPISGNVAAEGDAEPDAATEGVQAESTKAPTKPKTQAETKGKKVQVRRNAPMAKSARKPPTAPKKLAKGRAKTKGKTGNKGDLLLSMLKRRGGASVQ